MKQKTIEALKELEELYIELDGLKDDIRYNRIKILQLADQSERDDIRLTYSQLDYKYGLSL